MGQSALIFQYKNINKYKMKFLIPLLVLLATSQAEKHPGKHNHTDIEALARRLATIIFRRIQETDNIQPIPSQSKAMNINPSTLLQLTLFRPIQPMQRCLFKPM